MHYFFIGLYFNTFIYGNNNLVQTDFVETSCGSCRSFCSSKWPFGFQ